MRAAISTKELRASLPKVLRRVQGGERITVLYRSRPAFQIVPVDDSAAPGTPLEADPVYRARPVGRSRDGRQAADHDGVLYRS
ncbi:MAG TPA: type II toxin-antitoxin system prevent-host-death family antitoxin [Vicinamibacteria bacterium]|nr:type II toxin-antitoxin system prevent-host-death family antitoxin [Vicinamibacteria bacterium]